MFEKQSDDDYYVRYLFENNGRVQDHVNYLTERSRNRQIYRDTLTSMMENNISFTSETKARILVAIWAYEKTYRAGAQTPTRGLMFSDIFHLLDMSPTDVFKFIQLLDAPREAAALERKLHHWKQKNLVVRDKTVAKVKRRISELREEPHEGNVTVAITKRIKRWTYTIPSQQLDYYVLNFPETLKFGKLGGYLPFEKGRLSERLFLIDGIWEDSQSTITLQ